MNADRELLKLAAKAAGIDALHDPQGVLRDCTGFHRSMNIFAAKPWNPLTDDGDALRLAVKLKLEQYHADDEGEAVYVGYPRQDSSISYCIEYYNDIINMGDPYAATRRAIVRAAAEIGRAMK